MESKHTPGTLHAHGEQIDVIYVDGHERHYILARALDHYDDYSKLGIDHDTMMANAARLAACWNGCRAIPNPAAVPKLLAAVENAVASIAVAMMPVTGTDVASARDVLAITKDGLKVALAEARSERPETPRRDG